MNLMIILTLLIIALLVMVVWRLSPSGRASIPFAITLLLLLCVVVIFCILGNTINKKFENDNIRVDYRNALQKYEKVEYWHDEKTNEDFVYVYLKDNCVRLALENVRVNDENVSNAYIEQDSVVRAYFGIFYLDKKMTSDVVYISQDEYSALK